MDYSFQLRDVWANFDLLIDGAVLTVWLSALTMAVALPVGIIGALMRTSEIRPLRAMAGVYVETIRNTPLLVQLFIVYFGLASLGLRFGALEAAIMALIINLGAYLSEIIRAGIQAIHRSQIEAGLSLGLSKLQVFRYVVLFPALKITFPALSSQFILLLLATSIVSQIGVEELFHMGGFIESRTFRSFEVYFIVAVLYLILAQAFRLVFRTAYYALFERRRAVAA